MGKLTRQLAAFGLVATIGLSLAPLASAASWATFGTPSAASTYGTGVDFSQPVTVDRAVARVELLLTVADAIGPTVIEVATPDPTVPRTLEHLLDTSGDGHLLPNTPIVARWRLTAADDPAAIALGPALRVTYADDRFVWQTEGAGLVRVHWYDGSAAFGRRALQIGEDGVRKAAALLGVTESKSVDFFVYGDRSAFYDALGPGTHENVGGEADAGIRTLFALIPPSQIDDAWVGTVIPHELTHLVFDTAAGNPYHLPPHWLNEGLAVYESQGYDNDDRDLVAGAVSAHALIPLDGLVGQFPRSADGFFQAYAESVSAVDFMVRTYGSDALVKLVRSYKDGRTDDEAMQAGLGVDSSTFASAWLSDLGAKPPVRYGPQPAPAGPLPAAWGPGPAEGPSAAPGAPATPVDRGTDLTPVIVVLLLAVGIVVAVAAAVVVRRARHGRAGGTPA